ncbi:protocadherin alpha-2-like isoform X1 [Polypterus senegalus]|uniref:protocadherin alpha-2-like isoform X1 n=1 Tax=Polypterus senegalus TaxID=55291 RepID=UPI001966AF86|nr:protocadherin alpha-2-like isoform X1 [Polypterus senegalus]
MKELRMFQRTALFTAFLLCSWTTAFAHLIYSVHEESTPGTIIGNIVKDLGLDLRNLEVRGFRLISGSKQELLKVNRKTGMLSVNEIIDRELLCAREDACFVNIKIVIENPLEIHPAQIEILDVNDNSPAFPENTKTLEMSEITPAGSRFPLEGAYDPDTGPNSLKFYQLSGNDFFVLEVKEDSKKNKIPLLVLQKPLDREENAKFNFLLLAVDGGNPPKSGSMNISILVEDVNDNVPIFLEQTYSVTLEENSPLGALVVKVNASDLDEGKNSEIIYSFGSSVDNTVRELFELDSNTGYITVKGVIDFEQKEFYEFDIKATDRGQVPMSSHCTVLIKVKDRNDNAPVIEVTSLTSSILENAKTGTIVGLITITDLDSGINSKIKCTLSDKVPFEMKPSFQENLYSLVTKSQLDRESANQYNVTITAKDLGHPSLSSYETVLINVLDVNDNHPKFLQDPYVFYIEENNTPGASVFAVSAVDVDANENALVTYYLREKEVVEKSLVPFLSINPDNGQVFSFTIFDFEEVKSFAFNVIAKDSGVPSLSSNVTVNVFILDQNDNPPVIVFPLTKNGTAVVEETIPRNVKSGYFVTRIKAYDADVGYNAWLSFSLEEATDRSVFSVGRYTGEIRTHRAIGESDVTVHKLVILVKDGGRISFSASATVIVTVAENMEANIFSEIKSTSSLEKQENKMTVFLIIVLSSVSSLFVITIITLMVCKCHRRNAFLSNNYIFDTNYAEVSGSLFHQYQAAEKQLVFVGPDMNSKSVLDVGSNRNTLVISDGGIKIAQAEEATDRSLFSVGRYTGEVRTQRAMVDSDVTAHKLVILAKDSGRVSLSTSATVIVIVAENVEAHAFSEIKSTNVGEVEENKMTFYLIIILSSVSSLFIITVITLIAFQCHKAHQHFISEKYIGDTSYVEVSGSLFHSQQYQTGEKRFLYVGPDMDRNSVMDMGNNGNTLVMSDSGIKIQPVTGDKQLVFIGPGMNRDSMVEVGSNTNTLLVSDSGIKIAQVTGDKQLVFIGPGMNRDSMVEVGSNTNTLLVSDSGIKIAQVPKQPNTDWRYSASLRAGMQSSVHMEESAVLQGPSGVHIQNWPTVSSATPEPEAGEVSPPVGAGINSNSWTFKYGPPAGNPQQLKPGEVPENFIIPGSPAIISIRQGPPGAADDKSDFITFGKKEETKKKKKKKKGKADKKEKANDGGDH